MFNSLPNNLKEKIRSEYYLRLFIVVLFSVFILQLSFLVLLLPSWFISLDKEKTVASRTEENSLISLDEKIETVTFKIKSINSKLNIINSSLKYPEMVPFVDTILSQKTKDIYIKDFIYRSSGENYGTISLSGVSSTRETLVSFVKKLEETKRFESVDLPISNFAKDRDINFFITMTIVL